MRRALALREASADVAGVLGRIAGGLAVLCAFLVAASAVGVAGTTFSITVAALALASGQMGPRLLRSFVRDAGNQLALGVFLGSFAYALLVLRSVRGTEEGAYVPHLGVTGGLALAPLRVAALVWFVHHIADGINVDTVIAVVHEDLRATMRRTTLAAADPPSPPAPGGGQAVTLQEGGYLRSLDEEALADRAAAAECVAVLRACPGDHLFSGMAVAHVVGGAGADGGAKLRAALSVGPRQAAAQDPEFAVRQLVEVAVRALSLRINDPFTAFAVLDHLGATLCDLRTRHLPASALRRDGRVVLYRRVTDYNGLCDAMFHMIRQNAASSAVVLIHLLDVLAAVLAVETAPARSAALRWHADLAHALAAKRESVRVRTAVAELEARHAALAPER